MIKIRNLNYSYKTFKRKNGFIASLKDLFIRKYFYNNALQNINIDIKKGEIVGLLGMNGAGKTTLIKCIVGLLKPNATHISVNDYFPYQKENDFLKSIGVVIGQKSQLIWDLPPIDSLTLLRAIYEIPPDIFDQRLNKLSNKLSVEHLLHTPVRKLSLGERMKFELISSLIHYPDLLILDEPTIGLDIISQKIIRDFLLFMNKENDVTILITSHNMEDIKDLCSRLIILETGKIIYDDLLEKLGVNDNDDTYMMKIKTYEPLTNKKILSYPYSYKNSEYTFKIKFNQIKNVFEVLESESIMIKTIEVKKEPFEDRIFKFLNEKRE